jgi:ABC-2 type transport system ATP-binding protein
MNSAIRIEEVSKAYRGHQALDGVSLNIPKAGIYGLLGPNGAGKTTLIRMLAGITAPDAGSIAFFGEPLTKSHQTRVGYLPEERGLYKNMKVGEQALYLGQLRGLSRSDAGQRLKHWFERLEVDGWWNRPVADLSKGMAQKIQFITTVLHEPDLLILDEPLSGFDPINAQRIREIVQELAGTGTTVLLSTHDMPSVEELCTEVSLLHQGEVLLAGGVSQLREQARRGRVKVVFEGQVIGFTAALGASAELVQVTPSGHEGHHEAILRLPEGSDWSEWIRWLSQEVRLVACEPYATSMREIFIQAVDDRVAANREEL